MISAKKPRSRKGFTMIELLTSVAITAIIVSVLVGMTSIAIDAWKDSRDKTKASRQAQEALETLSKDLEAIIIRPGNPYEWAFVKSETGNQDGPKAVDMSNPTEIVFFTGATDRYEGQVGEDADNGGDVSTVAYRIVYQDQLEPQNTEDTGKIFALYRDLINPDETFEDYLSKSKDDGGLMGIYSDSEVIEQNNFLAENIFDLTITFLFEYQDSKTGQTVTKRVPITTDPDPRESVKYAQGAKELRIFGNTVEINGAASPELRLAGCELSIFVLTDSALTVLKNRSFSDDEERAKFLEENGYHYSKSVTLPRP